MVMARFLIPLSIFLALAALFAVMLQRAKAPGYDPRAIPSPLIGKAVPRFQLPRLLEPSKQFDSAILKGKVSLVNVWASWCVECRIEHPYLLELARTQDVPIYALNWKDKRQDALAFLNELGNPYKIIGFDGSGTVGINWGVYGVPETYVVDRAGTVRLKVIGPLSPQRWRDKVLPMIHKLQEDKG